MKDPIGWLRVSYSSLNTFDSCYRRFEFDKLYPRPPRDKHENYAADVGKALHAGYQNYLIHHDQEKAILAMMLEFPFEGEFNQENDYRSFEAALSTLEEMFLEVKMDDYELAKILRPNTPEEIAAGLSGGVEVPAIEVPFSIKFRNFLLPDGRGVEFIGFIDAVLRHYLTGMFRTCDIKTTRDRLKDSTGKFMFDAQQVPYGLVVDRIAGNAGQEFEVLYLNAFVDLAEPKVTMYPFLKTPLDVQEWFTNTILQLQQLQQFMAADYFPRRKGGCIFYNKPCHYLNPCQMRDKEELMTWFLMGVEPEEKKDDFFPWLTVEINVEG